MSFALIDPQNPGNGQGRVADVQPQTYDVASPLYWIDLGANLFGVAIDSFLNTNAVQGSDVLAPVLPDGTASSNISGAPAPGRYNQPQPSFGYKMSGVAGQLVYSSAMANSLTVVENGSALGFAASSDLRQVIPASAFGNTLPAGFYLSFEDGSSPGTDTVDAVYVGYAASSGNAYDFDGSQVQVTFGGATSVTLGSGAIHTSDLIGLPSKPGTALVIAVHVVKGSGDTSVFATSDSGAFPGATTYTHNDAAAGGEASQTVATAGYGTPLTDGISWLLSIDAPAIGSFALLASGTSGQYVKSQGNFLPPTMASIALGDLPAINDKTILGNVSGSPATPTTVTLGSGFGVAGSSIFVQAWCNTRLAQSADYTVFVGDKFKTIALGGSAFFTLTFSAASGYDAAFAVMVVNEDTTRGKAIAINGLSTFILWPLQSVLVFNQNNTWQVHVVGPPRWRLSASTTFNVDTTNGSDSNDGLATTTGAFATIGKALSTVFDKVDLNNQSITISVATGTYNEQLTISNPFVGRGTLTLQGDTTTPTNVNWQAGSGTALNVQNGAVVSIAGFYFTGTSSSLGTAIQAALGSTVTISGKCDFGAIGTALQIIRSSKVVVSNNYTISGSQNIHYNLVNNAILITAGRTITLTGTPAWGTAFIQMTVVSSATMNGMTFSGSATGKRFSIQHDSSINTSGGFTPTYFPGDTLGTFATYGSVDNLATGLSSRNILSANGGLELWQRGAGDSASIAVAASTTAYTADRWYITTGANQACTISNQAGLTNQSQCCAQVQRNSGQTGTGTITFGYPLTKEECIRLRGQSIALQFFDAVGTSWSPTSGTFTYNVYFGTGTEGKRGAGFTGESNPITGTVSRAGGGSAKQATDLSGSTVDTSATQGEIQFTWSPTGTAGSNDWIQFDDVQLEAGTYQTTFERPSIAQMLEECQRHFAKTFPYNTAPAQSGGVAGALSYFCQTNVSSGNFREAAQWRFPVSMRASPTITTYNPSASNANWRDITGAADQTVSVDPDSLKSADSVDIGGTSNATGGRHSAIHATADAGL